MVVRERDVSEHYLSGHDRVAADDSVSLRGLANCDSELDISGRKTNVFEGSGFVESIVV